MPDITAFPIPTQVFDPGVLVDCDFSVATGADLVGRPPGPKQKALALDTNMVWAWTGSAWVDTGESPLKRKRNIQDPEPGIASASGSPISVDTVAQTVTVTGRIVAGRRSYLLPAPLVLSYASMTSNVVVSVSLDDGSGALTPVNSLSGVPENHAILGVLWGLQGYLYGAGSYLRDGVLQGELDAQAATLFAKPDNVVVSTTASTITFTDSRVVFSSGVSATVTTVLNYSSVATSPTSHYLYFNALSSSYAVATVGNLPKGAVVVARFHPSEGRLFGLHMGYTRDGALVGQDTPLLGRQAMLYGTPATVSVNTATKTVSFNGGRMLADGGISQVLSAQTIDYSSMTGAALRYIVVAVPSGTVSIVTSVNIPTRVDRVVIGTFRADTGQINGLPGGYTVDGGAVGAPSFQTGDYYASASAVSIDTLAGTITINGGRVIGANGVTFAPGGPHVATIPSSPTTSHLVFGTDRTPRLVPTSPIGGLVPGDIVVGRYDSANKLLIGVPGGYLLNGLNPMAEKHPPHLGWEIDGVLTAPAMPGYRPSDPLPLAAITSATIIGWFDALMAANPDYITRTLLGSEPGDSLPIYEYRFLPPMGRVTGNVDGITANHPKIMIQGGIHNEPNSYVYPYHMMRLICEDWASDPFLEALRWGVEFSVIPTLSPWGIDNNSYVNSNGVNINRNYPVMWSLNSEPGNQNSGPAPLSEIETQCSHTIMQSFKPHLFFDCHDFGVGRSDRFIWLPSSSAAYCAAARAVINRLARKWQGEDVWMPPANVLGEVAGSGARGVSGRTAVSLGIIGGTFEAGRSLYWEPGTSNGAVTGSPLTVKRSVEALGNMMLTLLRQVAV